MKNSKNKVVAGIVVGMIMGSVGTSLLTTYQVNGHNNNFEHDNYQRNFEQGEGQEDGMHEGMQGQGKGRRGGGRHQGEGSLEASESIDVESGQYKDGTYKGQANGYAADMEVEVKISSGKITNVEVVSHNETPGFYEKAFEEVPASIVEKQSTDVDTISGATYSSVGIINAVNDALSDAKTTTDTTTDTSNLETVQQ